jgi:Cu-processing system ATP-binding protein
MSLVEEFSDRIILLMEGKIIFKGGLEEILKESGKDSLENAIAYLVNKNGNGKVH